MKKKLIITIEHDLENLVEERYFRERALSNLDTQAEIVKDAIRDEIYKGNVTWEVKKIRG